MSSATVTPTPEMPPLSEAARIVDTFVAPSKTFSDIRRSAKWWAPFLLMAIVSVAFVYVVDKKIGFQKATENQIQQSPKAAARLDQLPPAQREQQVAQQVKFTRIFSYGFFLFILLWYLLVAAILYGTFKLAAGATGLKFGQTYAVTMYAGLPGVLKTILAIFSILAGAAADSFTMQNPLASNPGYFMTPGEAPFLHSIATSLDVFMIWTLVLAGIGFSLVGKVKKSTAMAVVFGWYVVLVLVGAGFAAAFS
jgi:Yip1 domain